MGRHKWKAKHVEAMALYLKGHPIAEISEITQVAERTIYSWERRGNWKDFLDTATQKAVKKVLIDIESEKERSLTLIKAAESYWANKLKAGELKPGFSDMANIQRVKWDILNPKSSQVNVFNATTPEKYVIEIVNPGLKKEAEVL